MGEDPSLRTSATVDIDGLSVFYEVQGEGSPLVLLHGGMATNTTWNAQFAGLAPHRRVVAPERQAHGHTPDRAGPLTYQAMAEQTVAFIQSLGLAPCDLLGWSDGGMIGILVAAHHPELVRSLAMTGSGFASSGYVDGAMEEFIGRPADDPDMAMFAGLYAEASPDGAGHFPVVWDKVRSMWAEPFDWSDLLERITAPVLVIVGDDDFISVSHAEELACRVPNGQLAVIPGASHVVPMEKPDLFNRVVLDFLDAPDPHTWLPLRRKLSS
jgi:pimeloyl-ACP methyl ester carboxylesterase